MSDVALHDAPSRVRDCRLVEWKPWPFESGSLIGHATVSFSGWTVHAIPVFKRSDGALSVGVPTMPIVDGAGNAKLKDGKKSYAPVVSFESGAARERWNRAVLFALLAAGIGAAP